MNKPKTNAMRMMDKENISYELKEIPLKGGSVAVDDVHEFLGIPKGMLFKTLVTTDTLGSYFVFCLPSVEELDLKKAARAAGVKRIEMLRQKELFPLTGYVHGGCSPVGMKKLFPTVIDESAQKWDSIIVSAGKLGMLMEVSPKELKDMVSAEYESITKE